MRKNYALVVATALLATGCTSTAIYSDSIAEFDKAFTSTRDIVKSKDAAMDEVKRRKQMDETFYADEVVPTDLGDPRLTDFVSTICVSSDYLINQRAAIGTLASYDAMLQRINKRPKDDLGAIAASISENMKAPESLVAAASKPRTTAECATEVRNLVTLRREIVPEFAVLAALTSAIAVVDAARQLAIDGGHIMDDAVRGARMTRYVRASDVEVGKALALLNAEDPGVKSMCAKLAVPYGAPCRGKDATYTRLDGVAIAEKWAALRDPWHLYLSMYEIEAPARAGAAANGAAKAINSYYVTMDKYQADLGTSLEKFQALRANPTAGDVGRAMKEAQATLMKIANGDITPQQGYAALKALAEALEAVSKDLKAVRAAEDDFVSMIRK